MEKSGEQVIYLREPGLLVTELRDKSKVSHAELINVPPQSNVQGLDWLLWGIMYAA